MVTLKKGMVHADVEMLQKALNEKLKKELVPDGGFGGITEMTFKEYEKKYGFPVTGIFDSNVHKELWDFMNKRFVSIGDIEAIAKQKGIDPNMLRAIRKVEGLGSGFLSDGRPLILFERHKFYENIKTKFGVAKAEEIKAKEPSICHPVWDAKVYLGYKREYDRLNLAITFDRECALKSASWGMFQILGSNFKICGYSNVQEFVDAMYASEDLHLKAVVSFIMEQPKLLHAITTKNFVRIAEIYNGPQQAKHNYSGKIETAYKSFIA